MSPFGLALFATLLLAFAAAIVVLVRQAPAERRGRSCGLDGCSEAGLCPDCAASWATR